MEHVLHSLLYYICNKNANDISVKVVLTFVVAKKQPKLHIVKNDIKNEGKNEAVIKYIATCIKHT